MFTATFSSWTEDGWLVDRAALARSIGEIMTLQKKRNLRMERGAERFSAGVIAGARVDAKNSRLQR